MSKKSIHIIGGGIIGLCSAYFLNKEGVDVTIIDKGDLSDGASHGNSGIIVPSHFIPLASPGVIAKGIKWMFDSKSPFYIKPRLSIDLAQWLWKFYKASNRDQVNKAIPVLYDFNKQSKHLYQDFSEMSDFDFGYEEKGLLMLYKTTSQEREEIKMADFAHKIGVEAKIMSKKEITRIEPDIDLDVMGGLYFKGDAHFTPNKFISQLIDNLSGKGVKFITNKKVIDFKTRKGAIEKIIYPNEEALEVDNVLLCCGSWTGLIAKKLGINISLQDGKGYSTTFKDIDKKPRIPAILSEVKVAITPMGNDLRIGGTLEISNHSKEINRKRLNGILESIPRYYPNFKLPVPKQDNLWLGYRPCSPDGMPYIDKSQEIDNCYIATGHGMMGMSLGPATGKMICEIFTDKITSIPTELMKIDRF